MIDAIRLLYVIIEGNSSISKTIKCIFPVGEVFALGSHHKTKALTSPTFEFSINTQTGHLLVRLRLWDLFSLEMVVLDLESEVY